MSDEFIHKDVQGNILHGYKSGLVRHLILEVQDHGTARAFLGASAAGENANVPRITSEAPWDRENEPYPFFNIGLTYEGLRALGTPEPSLFTFPTEFKEGMNKRALKLGDFGCSAPANWPAPFDNPARIHCVASVYANDAVHLDRVQAQVAGAFGVLGVRDGRKLAAGFFGYRDGISHPRFPGIGSDKAKVGEPIDPLGTALLGYPTRLEGLRFRVPEPRTLGFNGSFSAFRVLAQDAAGFEAYLDKAAEELLIHRDVDKLLPPPGEEWWIGKDLDRKGALREIVAAQMCGRWRNGVPLATSPDTPFPDPEVSLTEFDYDGASRCPAGAHIRRTNPRGGTIVQRVANHTRRLVRRGMSYGPDFDPAQPDDQERGLLGNFIGASLGAQFEAVMCDWLNLGLQDPNITGAHDPLTGANSSETSWFDLSAKNGGNIRLRGLPRFVTTRGGAYMFLPSLTAIEYLSKLTG